MTYNSVEGAHGEQDYAVFMYKNGQELDIHLRGSSFSGCISLDLKETKLEVTLHKCSPNLVSVIADGKCIISTFLKPRPGSVLTTHINDSFRVVG